MPLISTSDRVKLNYAVCTIGSIVVYTLTASTFSTQFLKLWLHSIYFIIAELIKLLIVQKLYSLDVTYNMEGTIKRRSNKLGDSIKFAGLMMVTVFVYALICIIMGGAYEQTTSKCI